MSNLAYQQEKQQRPVISPEKKGDCQKRGLPLHSGKRSSLVLFAIAVLSTSMFIVSKAYAAYQSNIEVQQLEEKVSEKNKQIGDLEKDGR